MIKIDNLSVCFSNIVINYPNKTFKKNKATFITGRNGVGKTTLLKSLARLLKYEGSIAYQGVATYLSQEPTLFNRSVYENIVYPLRIRQCNLDLYNPEIFTYAKMLELDHLLYQNAKTLSSGEKMKTAFLRSIIFSPDLVLLDEPTTHLDIESIEQITQLIQTLKKTMTFLIISHNKSFLSALKDDEYYLGGSHVQRKND